jgi:ADP-ribose pyrophosphatase
MQSEYDRLCIRTLAQKMLFQGHIINLRQDDVLLPNGVPSTRDIVEHPGAVCVAALTANNELLFVRQFRYAFGEVMTELPAGKIDAGEDPLNAAKRELREETGATAAQWKDMGIMLPTVGYCNEKIYFYLATGLSFGDNDPDEDEFLELHRIPLGNALRMVLADELPDGKTQTLILKLFARQTVATGEEPLNL